MRSNHKLIGSVLFAVLWAVVAAWPAISERRLEKALPMSVVGFAIAAATTVLLAIGGLLQGPSLLPWGGAGLESTVAAGIGAALGVFGAIAATRRRQSPGVSLQRHSSNAG